jgi:hypothetical protein
MQLRKAGVRFSSEAFAKVNLRAAGGPREVAADAGGKQLEAGDEKQINYDCKPEVYKQCFY